MSLTKKNKTVKVNSNKVHNKYNTKTCKTINRLNIYKITNIDKEYDPMSQWDCAIGFIIISRNELSARQMIYKTATLNGYTYYNTYGDEEGRKKDFWLNSEYSKCELIGKSCLTNEGIVLRYFNSG